MGILEDVIKALERIPAWKRMQDLPQQVSQLQARVAALEAELAPATGDQCPKCRSMSFMLDRTEPQPPPWGEMGEMQDVRICSSCGYQRADKRP
jgi:hypothetical protein